MAITNPQDVGCYTVTSTGIHKALHYLLILEEEQENLSVIFLLHTLELNANITIQTEKANYTYSV